MRILALNATKNTDKPDAQGAFIPQSEGFAKYRRAHGDIVESVGFDNLLPDVKRRGAFVDAIRNASKFDALVYFGHGTRRGLPSAGFTLATIDALVDAINARAAENLIIALYACSTANTPIAGGVDGDGGFADVLRDKLSTLGHKGWIDAHTIAGHATINRYSRRFYLSGDGPGTGGTWLIAPGSPEWGAWGELLKSDRDLRFGFPFMTEGELHARLPG